MESTQYRVMLEKEAHVFSSAHFITFNGNICESLHGHNYRVKCEVHGPLDENSYVVDFIALRDSLSEIIRLLDHHVLLPTQHAQIQVVSNETEVTATFEAKRWIFPKEDCVLLPVDNTTAEQLASYIGKELRSKCFEKFNRQISKIVIFVDENYGQWGVAEMAWEPE